MQEAGRGSTELRRALEPANIRIIAWRDLLNKYSNDTELSLPSTLWVTHTLKY